MKPSESDGGVSGQWKVEAKSLGYSFEKLHGEAKHIWGSSLWESQVQERVMPFWGAGHERQGAGKYRIWKVNSLSPRVKYVWRERKIRQIIGTKNERVRGSRIQRKWRTV